MSKTRKAAARAAATKTKLRTIPQSSEESRNARAASFAVSADRTAAIVVTKFSGSTIGDVFTEVVKQLEGKVAAVHRGDLRDGEALLMTQAVGLNSIYTELVLLARQYLKDHFDAAERLMRLGLKAQGQCRATLETLAMIKNPPVVFARHANIAHGPQQVNNSLTLARAGNPESEPNKLLEIHGERLDLRAAGTTGTGDQTLATVGARHRTKNG